MERSIGGVFVVVLVNKEFDYNTDCDSDTKLEGQVYFFIARRKQVLQEEKFSEAESHFSMASTELRRKAQDSLQIAWRNRNLSSSICF